MASEMATEVAEKIQEAAGEIHEVYAPQWNSRADVLKTIISLSSASIVLSVTFSNTLRSVVVNLHWRRLIFLSFVLLVASLLFAFLALWIGTRVYELQSNLFNKRKEIETALLEALPSKEKFLDAVDQIVQKALDPIAQNDKSATVLFRISCVCFFAAIVLLAAVGGKQLLL